MIPGNCCLSKTGFYRLKFYDPTCVTDPPPQYRIDAHHHHHHHHVMAHPAWARLSPRLGAIWNVPAHGRAYRCTSIALFLIYGTVCQIFDIKVIIYTGIFTKHFTNKFECCSRVTVRYTYKNRSAAKRRCYTILKISRLFTPSRQASALACEGDVCHPKGEREKENTFSAYKTSKGGHLRNVVVDLRLSSFFTSLDQFIPFVLLWPLLPFFLLPDITFSRVIIRRCPRQQVVTWIRSWRRLQLGKSWCSQMSVFIGHRNCLIQLIIVNVVQSRSTSASNLAILQNVTANTWAWITDTLSCLLSYILTTLKRLSHYWTI